MKFLPNVHADPHIGDDAIIFVIIMSYNASAGEKKHQRLGISKRGWEEVAERAPEIINAQFYTHLQVPGSPLEKFLECGILRPSRLE